MSNTYKSSYTGAQIDEAVSKILNGISGDCTAPHVLTVPELPTENIDEQTVYKCGDIYYRYGESDKTITHLGVVVGGVITETYTVQQLIAAEGMILHYEVSRPDNPIESSITIIHAYYIETEDDILVYGDIDSDETTPPEWVPMWSTTTGDGERISTFRGAVTSIDEAGENPEDGVYALIEVSKGWKSYGHPCIIDVDTLPTENIAMDAIYRVSDEECVDVGIYNDDGQYMSIIAILSALLEVQIKIFNVTTLDVVTDPIPFPLAFYYCKADRMLYSWDEEEGKWDACDGKDEDSLGIPGWQTANRDTYCKPQASGFTDLIVVDGGIQMSYKQFSPNIHFHTIDTVPEEITDEYEKTDENGGAIHLYYAEQDQDVGGFILDETTSEYVWMSFLEEEDMELTGVISHTSEITGDGVYVLIGSPWKKYIRPSGTLTVTENNKTFDTTEYESVTVSIPSYTGKVVYE